jgi:hypothetical protein
MIYLQKICIVCFYISELYLEIGFDNESFEITSIVHPSTYLNKIVIGSRQGSMQLWNIKTNKLLFTFPGWGQAITIMEQVWLAGLGKKLCIGWVGPDSIIGTFQFLE